MSFLNPFFLIGLAALSIPVIIHLINLRKPKRIAFSTIAFFSELQKSTIRRLNIKRLLLLAVRIAAIVLLVLALARPFLPPQLSGFSESGSTLYTFLVDNGPSMAQIDSKGPYLDQSKDIINEILDRADNRDRFLIAVTHGEQLQNRVVSRSEARALLDDIEVVNMGRYTAERLHDVKSRMLDYEADARVIYWISDAAETKFKDLERYGDGSLYDERAPVQFIKIGDEPSVNVGVTEVKTPNQIIGRNVPMTIEVTVQNFGNEPVSNQFLDVEVENRTLGQYEVALEPGQQRSYLFEYVPEQTGDVRGVARLEGDQFTFDNQRYFALLIPETRNIALIQNSNYQEMSFLEPVLEAARLTSAQINYQKFSVDAFRQETIAEFDAVIINAVRNIPEYMHEPIQRYIQNGGGLIVFPGQDSDMSTYNRLLERVNAGRFTGIRGDYGRFEETAGFQRLREGHPILDEIFDKQEDEDIRIDLPSIYYQWLYETAGRSGSNVIFQTNLNEPVLTEHQFGSGLVLVSSLGADPGWSNFPVNPLFAPLYYRMALYAVSFDEGGLNQHTLGRPFEWNYGFGNLDISILLNDREFRPEVSRTGTGADIRTDAVDWTPGWAIISDGEQERTVAVNQDITESDFRTLQTGTIRELLSENVYLLDIIDSSEFSGEELSTRIQSAGFGSEIWNWFLWAALVFLIIECLISKQYRVENRT